MSYILYLLLVCFFFFLSDKFLHTRNLVLNRVPSLTRKTRATSTMSIHSFSRYDPLRSSMGDP